MKIVVIGAGIVGVCCAIELLRAGHDVTVVDPGPPGGEQAASYGNGCWLSPASVIPPAVPGLWRRVPRFLADPLGPLAIRWRYLPRVAPWLVRYLLSGWTEARVWRTARQLRPLLEHGPALHAALAAEAGVPGLIGRRGLLYVYPGRADWEAEAMSWRVRARVGLTWQELDTDALWAMEPTLAGGRYRFGIFLPEGAHCTDPGAYVAALARLATARGAAFRQVRATGFDIRARRLVAVRTEADNIPADRAVIAAGAHARPLARAAGDRVPLDSERGYHAVIIDPEARPGIPALPSDGRMSVTLTDTGLRCAGQVEIAGLRAAPDWRRAAILRDHLLAMFPALPRDMPPERVRVWFGHRPSMPGGVPVLRRARGCTDVVHAFGHGHVGLVAAPASAQVVAGLVGVMENTLDGPGPRSALDRL